MHARREVSLALVALIVALNAATGFAGTISTVAGTGESTLNASSGPVLKVNIGQPFGVEIGPDGALYVAEVGNHRVLKIDRKSGRLTTAAGNGRKGYSGDGGPATEASLNEPYEIRFDLAGNMYFVEMRGSVIRKVDAKTRIISTIAGTGKHGFGGDGGPASKATFKSPHSIALDGRGRMYVADIGNHRIREINLKTGEINTIAGTGAAKNPTDGSVATGKPIRGPRALHVVEGVLWIALREGHSVWKMDLETKRITHVAGTGKKGYRDGAASEAMFNGPKGIVAGPRGVFVVDTENQVIRRIDPETNRVSTVAGVGPEGRGYGGDGGPATDAKMDRPHGITMDRQGVLYIGDTNTHRVRRVAPD
ncbi:MAG: hypothetical protein N2C14_33415 [Planctomycetales bacterium]